MDEYEESLSSFREERTETFTLLYPNVFEVASVLYGLYPERVQLSLGEDEILDGDQDDISRRFERFNQFAGGGSSTFMKMTPGTVSSAGGGGSSGTISFNGGRVSVVPPLPRLALDDARRLSEAAKEGGAEGESAAEEALRQHLRHREPQEQHARRPHERRRRDGRHPRAREAPRRPDSEIQEDGASIPIYSAASGGLVQEVPVDIVSSRSVTGTFVAKDDMTMAVGGLIKEVESDQESRVPILGSIPLLGWLFRSTERVKQRTELIVLIRPHVISTPAEGEDISRRVLDATAVHGAHDGRSVLGVLPADPFGDAAPLRPITEE